MIDALSHLFAEPLECDKQHKYRADSCNVYYENRVAASVHKVTLSNTIKEIVSEKGYVELMAKNTLRNNEIIYFYSDRFLVSGGCLIFYVVPKDSTAETEYVNKKRHPLMKPL